MDYVRIAYSMVWVSIVVAMISSLLVVWANRGSETLALACAALVGAAVLFLVQLPFQLRQSLDQGTAAGQLVLNRDERLLRPFLGSVGQTRSSSGERVGTVSDADRRILHGGGRQHGGFDPECR